jgi:dTDP-4-dehydrorhamnose 3,5-epimerase
MGAVMTPTFSPLKKIHHPKGGVLHALKMSDPSFVSFGEAYFTTIISGDTKGWKLHKEMFMNLIVPVGSVRFHIYDQSQELSYRFDLGEDNYGRLTIPAGLWVAFSGLAEGLNLILNIASIEHDPSESLNLPLDSFEIK